MEPTRVHITTYGCQMNQLDAELAAEVLRAAGAEVAADQDRANVLLFLTCSVRGHAEDRVFSNIGALAGRKRRRPGLVIGLLGCMAQQFGEEVRRRAPLVDLVCAPGRLAELPDLIARARAGAEATALDPRRAEARLPGEGGMPTPLLRGHASPGGETAPGERRAGHATPVSEAAAFAASDAALDGVEVRRLLGPASAGAAYVTVMRGCDNFCTYCVVPHVRGPERSRPPRSILEEVRRLAGQGARQVTLLGQAVNQYAAEEDGRRWDLADLVARAAETPDLARLSFITSHPQAMTERLAAVFRDVPKVVPYLHMPAQSGSDAVLARMNRGYTAAEYEDRVAMVRARRPGLKVESDFIVGFPGETAEDFEATVNLVRRVRFAGAFVFKYSPRPGTAAAERFPDDVTAAEKRRRHSRLLALVKEIAREQRSSPGNI